MRDGVDQDLQALLQHVPREVTDVVRSYIALAELWTRIHLVNNEKLRKALRLLCSGQLCQDTLLAAVVKANVRHPPVFSKISDYLMRHRVESFHLGEASVLSEVSDS